MEPPNPWQPTASSTHLAPSLTVNLCTLVLPTDNTPVAPLWAQGYAHPSLGYTQED